MSTNIPIITLTGSYPPIYNKDNSILIRESIQRAVEDQINTEIDVLVDGQVSADIVSIFTKKINGFQGNSVPFSVTESLMPHKKSIVAEDLTIGIEYSRKLGVKNKPFKAHITGPTTIAWSSRLANPSNNKRYNNYFDENLVMDLAELLAIEVTLIKKETKVEIIQIDEPIFCRIANNDELLKVGIKAVNTIAGKSNFSIFHVCGDIHNYLDSILENIRVDVICLEGEFLRSEKVDTNIYKKFGEKNIKVGFGCIPVNTDRSESIRRIQNDMRWAIENLGPQNIWGFLPSCGQRSRKIETVRKNNKLLVNAFRNIADDYYNIG